MKDLTLPKQCYGSICLKILQEFIEHHHLPSDLKLPIEGLSTHESLSRIFDVMIHSMGEEKRNNILEDVDKYKMSLPAAFRP